MFSSVLHHLFPCFSRRHDRRKKLSSLPLTTTNTTASTTALIKNPVLLTPSAHLSTTRSSKRLAKNLETFQTSAIPPMPMRQNSCGEYEREKPWRCQGANVIKGVTVVRRMRKDIALKDVYEDFLYGGGEGGEYVKFLDRWEKGKDEEVEKEEDGRSVLSEEQMFWG